MFSGQGGLICLRLIFLYLIFFPVIDFHIPLFTMWTPFYVCTYVNLQQYLSLYENLNKWNGNFFYFAWITTLKKCGYKFGVWKSLPFFQENKRIATNKSNKSYNHTCKCASAYTHIHEFFSNTMVIYNASLTRDETHPRCDESPVYVGGRIVNIYRVCTLMGH